jgi:hypothetical protein
LKKPKLVIKPVPWQHPGKEVYPMTFASVEVINKPLPLPFRFLSRLAAEACEMFIEFWTWADSASRVKVSIRSPAAGIATVSRCDCSLGPDAFLTVIANGCGIALVPESAARYYTRPGKPG